ncbi:MAG: sulfite exporter TauE/SafE family protein [Bacteroidales bacterium]
MLNLSSTLLMTTTEVVSLVSSGIFVGFVNTLAGGATIVSLTVLLMLGLPMSVANGTNRIPVIMQNIVAVGNFHRKGYVDWKKGIYYTIPSVIGALLGSFIVVQISERMVEICFGFLMILMLFFLIFKPSIWLKGTEGLMEKKVSIWLIILFFFVGIYGGFIHVGVGYFYLMALVLGSGYDLIRANALKNLIVLLYVPFSLIFFIANDQIRWDYGLTHAVGNMIGAYISSRWAVQWGTQFIRWMLIVIIVIFSSQLLGIIDLKSLLYGLIN